MLRLSYNRISSIHAHSFLHLPRLKFLYLYGNNMQCNVFFLTVLRLVRAKKVFAPCVIQDTNATSTMLQRVPYISPVLTGNDKWSGRQLVSDCRGACDVTPYTYVKTLHCRNCSQNCRHAVTVGRGTGCVLLELSTYPTTVPNYNNTCKISKCQHYEEDIAVLDGAPASIETWEIVVFVTLILILINISITVLVLRPCRNLEF